MKKYIIGLLLSKSLQFKIKKAKLKVGDIIKVFNRRNLVVAKVKILK